MNIFLVVCRFHLGLERKRNCILLFMFNLFLLWTYSGISFSRKRALEEHNGKSVYTRACLQAPVGAGDICILAKVYWSWEQAHIVSYCWSWHSEPQAWLCVWEALYHSCYHCPCSRAMVHSQNHWAGYLPLCWIDHCWRSITIYATHHPQQ